MKTRPPTRRTLISAGFALTLTLGATTAPAGANPDHLSPSSLDKGARPQIPYLVRDTLHDGHKAIPVAKAQMHFDLWTTAKGYVVTDMVRNRKHRFRVTAITKDGASDVIGRPRWLDSSAVAPSGTRMAWAGVPNDLRARHIVTVVNPGNGKVLARRSFRSAQVLAVTTHRVLLTRPGLRRHIMTWWWNYRTDTTRRISDQYAVRADKAHDRVVFSPAGANPTRCQRVAPLSHPSTTLWRSCGITPHAWSPDGTRAMSTWIYFDAGGTDRWVTVKDPGGERGGRITGRLDWDVTWEDDHHYLTMAQGDDGARAIIRCTPRGACERASRIWPARLNLDNYFTSPPAVLSQNTLKHHQ